MNLAADERLSRELSGHQQVVLNVVPHFDFVPTAMLGVVESLIR
jgi:hypothetical protein